MRDSTTSPGTPVHFYTKALNGNGIFYRQEDFILFTTVFSVEARRSGRDIIAFAPMFNHFHSLERVRDIEASLSSYTNIERIFVREYNAEYGRKGRIFMTPLGYAQKRIGKTAKSSMIYVFNNPVAGKLSRKAAEYRWSLLAYYDNASPFSEALKLSCAGRRLRNAVSLVNYAYESGLYLNYGLQRQIFTGLSSSERSQITDYILHKYNFLDYDGVTEFFGTYEKALLAMDFSAGAEYDLQEDYENYSDFRTMISYMKKLKGVVDCRVIDGLLPEEKAHISDTFHIRMGIRWSAIKKFLHDAGPSRGL